MNKEQYENIINHVWDKYVRSHWSPPTNPNGKLLLDQLWGLKPMQHSEESFIRELKTNPKFAKKWGLKIEERELSLEERQDLYFKLNPEFRLVHENMDKQMDNFNTPTKLITIIYNNKTIESYE
jgi:hypothetical protein